MSYRRLVQAAFFATAVYLALSHQWYGVEKAAPIDAYCPFGGVETALTLILTGEFVKRVYWSAVVLAVAAAAMVVVFGRAFCGFVCPFGALQEWLRAIGRSIGARRDYEPPPKADRPLRLLKYMILAAVVYLSYAGSELGFREYDPYVALMHFGEEAEEMSVGLIVLAAVVLAALFAKNLWCRYLCPLGAFLGLFNGAKRFLIRRDKGACVDCGTCNRVCPHGIDVQHQETVKDADCVSCLECVENCPVRCLQASAAGRAVKGSNAFALYAVGAFALLIAASMLLGVWEPAPASNILSQSGLVDVTAIRGSNTLENLVKTTGVPLEEFVEELGLPGDVDTSLKLKDIGARYNVTGGDGAPLETDDFRMIVAERLEIPYDGE